MKEFKYDVAQLIQGIKDRPCLWDKTLEVYKDRFERRKAWEEIFNLLDEEYESMSSEEKRLTGEMVLNKWTNIRDTFVKSLKLRMGKPRRKYILHDQLEFLCKTMDLEDSIQIQYTFMKEEQGSEEESALKKSRTEDDEEQVSDEEPAPKKRSKRMERSDDLYEPNTSRNDSIQSNKRRSKKKDSYSRKEEVTGNDIDFVEIEDTNLPADHNRLMNEDEAFFAALLPTVVKYSEDERLEFRIEVLSLMKRIKENRKWGAVDP